MRFIKNFLKRITAAFKNEDGMTMIEIMIVVTIIAIIAGLAASQFMGQLDNAKVKAAKIEIQTFSNAVDRYRAMNDSYPSTDEGLQQLIEAKMIKKKKDVLNDPWGNPYQYRSPGENDPDYEIWSFGADGEEGGEGINADIKSWE